MLTPLYCVYLNWMNIKGNTNSLLLNTSVGPLHYKGEGGMEEFVGCFGGAIDVGLQAPMSSMMRWCTWEGGSTESLRRFGEGLDEVVVRSHKEAEVGFDGFLLFGPSRNLRWVTQEEEAQIRCLTRKDGHPHLHLGHLHLHMHKDGHRMDGHLHMNLDDHLHLNLGG